MKEIELTKGKFAIVDDKDFDFLNQWKWHYSTGGYACRVEKETGKSHEERLSKNIIMHRLLVDTPREMDTDHINGNKLDNRRENLRVCTRSQNLANRPATVINKSGFKGVVPHKGKYEAGIRKEGKRIYLGIYNTPQEAALAYNDAAPRYFGEFSYLNIIGGSN
jgi:hypothetical protein